MSDNKHTKSEFNDINKLNQLAVELQIIFTDESKQITLIDHLHDFIDTYCMLEPCRIHKLLDFIIRTENIAQMKNRNYLENFNLENCEKGNLNLRIKTKTNNQDMTEKFEAIEQDGVDIMVLDSKKK
jgi:hypothetical protein